MTQMIPLAKLRLSDSNVRKSGETSISQLAADIEGALGMRRGGGGSLGDELQRRLLERMLWHVW